MIAIYALKTPCQTPVPEKVHALKNLLQAALARPEAVLYRMCQAPHASAFPGIGGGCSCVGSAIGITAFHFQWSIIH